MDLRKLDRLELPPTADMHVHLRQGAMMEVIVPQIRKGGVDTVFVMVSHTRCFLAPIRCGLQSTWSSIPS